MRLVLYVDHFPALSETFVIEELAALRRAGHEVRVETGEWAAARADLAEPPRIDCLAENSLPRRAADLAWLAARRPRAVLADVRAQRRWRREERVRPLRILAPMARRLARGGERHVHVHFAGPAALDALRLTRLAGITYSVTAHAYEIYRAPANLQAKLRGAAVAAGVADATVADLREIAGPPHAARVHKLAMGVDAAKFARRTPYPGGRHVVAVGRLVEKKGFEQLVDAVALLRGGVDRVTIAGDGPLREALERRIAGHGLGAVVRLAGAVQPADVPALLETADVFALPCVIAADGDRDALPVVVQEALAMEVPVVASDLMGLPEVVREPWGRLARPGDPASLAEALAEVLGRTPHERAAMGRAGRAFAIAERDVDRWAARLVELLQSTGVR